MVGVQRQMTHEFNREPSEEEVAEKMGMPIERVRKMMKIGQKPISLENPIKEDTDTTLKEIGKEFNLTKSGAEYIENSILIKLRRLNYTKSLAVYMSHPDQSLERLETFKRKSLEKR